MSASDRTASLGLFAAAAASWLVVAWVLTSLSPLSSTLNQLLGAASLGSAVALTAWPAIWFITPGRQRPHAEGRWATAGRRAALTGLVVGVVVLLRVIDALALPVFVFLVVTAVLVELALTMRR